MKCIKCGEEWPETVRRCPKCKTDERLKVNTKLYIYWEGEFQVLYVLEIKKYTVELYNGLHIYPKLEIFKDLNKINKKQPIVFLSVDEALEFAKSEDFSCVKSFVNATDYYPTPYSDAFINDLLASYCIPNKNNIKLSLFNEDEIRTIFYFEGGEFDCNESMSTLYFDSNDGLINIAESDYSPTNDKSYDSIGYSNLFRQADREYQNVEK